MLCGEMEMKKSLRNKEKGFTLLEVLIAVVIIVVLAASAVPLIVHQIEKSKESEAVATLGAIRSAELRLHDMTGRFIAAADEAGIQTALGLAVGGGFYNYKIIEADGENFLALATPIGPLSDWLEELKINKDGFVGYAPGGGGSSSGGSGGSSGGGSSGSSGGGSSDSSGGGSGGSSGASVLVLSTLLDVTPVQAVSAKPPFTGWAEDIQEVIDLLASATSALTSPGVTTGAAIAAYINANQIETSFIPKATMDEKCPPGTEGGSSALGCQESWSDGTSIIYILDDYEGNKYAAAAILAHEALHAIWWEDYYNYTQTGVPPTFGMPIPSGGIRSKNSQDQEYHGKLTDAEIWHEFSTTYGDAVYDTENLWQQLYYDEYYFYGKSEDVGKENLIAYYPSYVDLPEY